MLFKPNVVFRELAFFIKFSNHESRIMNHESQITNRQSCRKFVSYRSNRMKINWIFRIVFKQFTER